MRPTFFPKLRPGGVAASPASSEKPPLLGRNAGWCAPTSRTVPCFAPRGSNRAKVMGGFSEEPDRLGAAFRKLALRNPAIKETFRNPASALLARSRNICRGKFYVKEKNPHYRRKKTASRESASVPWHGNSPGMPVHKGRKNQVYSASIEFSNA